MVQRRRSYRMACASLALAGGLAVASSCDGQIVTAEHQVAAVVRGTVLDEANNGVAGATVTVRAYHDDQCSGTYAHEMFPSALTGSDGSFQARMLVALVEPFNACLVVIAQPPSSTGLGEASVDGVFVDFVSSGAIPDTAVVNGVLSEP